jgi:hypothetical protein
MGFLFGYGLGFVCGGIGAVAAILLFAADQVDKIRDEYQD